VIRRRSWRIRQVIRRNRWRFIVWTFIGTWSAAFLAAMWKA
jgi:hypothetical protein